MSYHTPVRQKRRTHHLLRSIDWPLLAAFTALILVLMLGWGFLRSLEQNSALAEQAKQSAESNRVLVDQVESLRDRLSDVNAQARHDRRVAAKERRHLLHQQEVMIKILRRAHVIAADETPAGFIVVSPGSGSSQSAPPSSPTQPHSAPQHSGGHSHQSGGRGPQNGSGGSGPPGSGGGGSDDGTGLGDVVGGLLDAPCHIAPLPTC